ncbi:MAG: phosphodiester glycosidase family protein [Rickettsia conorii subsp. raoultii]|uniref:Phosphodiester glycosidase family protein n=1 Tax=Rickettsia conorii subsp. raoultii TaxID=369822 RepID=A0ABY4U0R6_RICCR|nr:phosphodiester glycosidase family protein [Rickettsia conorii]URW78232.1 phosphodiester glycosidase family protein [Rickettsia conorii subsp. raoultii]
MASYLVLENNYNSLLIIDQGNIQITKASAKILVEIGNKSVIPNQVNYFSNLKDITFYNDVWVSTTLTPYTNQEILIDQNRSNFIIKAISKHGDNQIPQKGFILFFPQETSLPAVNINDSVKLNLEFIDKDGKLINLSNTASIVTGIPLLVQNGKNVVDNPKQDDPAHARTALGVRNDGTIVIVEHIYKQHVKDLKLMQVRSILRKEKEINVDKLTIPEALKILEKHLVNDTVIGLTKTELTDYMLSLGYESAINLDGGGSSTLFMGGKIINNVTGDEDEALGEHLVRLVSDAIVLYQII